MKTRIAGPNGIVSPGQVGNFTKEHAAQLVAGRYGAYETAAVTQPEATVKSPRKKSAKRKRK